MQTNGKHINGLTRTAKYQELKQQKYARQRPTLGSVGRFAISHSALSLTQLTLKPEIYINHNNVVLLSLNGLPQMSLLSRVCPSFPSAHFLAGRGKIKTLTVSSSRAFDSFTLPSGSFAFQWMHRSQALSQSLYAFPKAIRIVKQ